MHLFSLIDLHIEHTLPKINQFDLLRVDNRRQVSSVLIAEACDRIHVEPFALISNARTSSKWTIATFLNEIVWNV
jgi:hypothetical protein